MNYFMHYFNGIYTITKCGVQMMKFVRGRRSVKWITILLGLAVLYFLFQGLILRILSKDIKNSNFIAYQVNSDFDVPRGVRLEDKELYRPKEKVRFMCLDGSKYVPWKSINDDYCDCVGDGSDEPGTSACSQNGRFFCKGSGEYIVASRVNDGICDCCDGTDEWDRPFSLNKVKGNPTVKGLEISPCGNLCQDLLDHKYVNAQQRLGMRLKKKYILAGKGHTDGIYGKEGEFYKLSKECFQYNTAKSKYVFCPYRYVREDNGQYFYNMGRRTIIEGKREDGTDRLVMTNGDSRHCPGEKQRRTYVEFLCGLNDHVMNIHEDSTCVYTLRFSTPAAC